MAFVSLICPCMRRYFFFFALRRGRTLARRARILRMNTILMNLTHLNLKTVMRSPKRRQSQMNSVMNQQHIEFTLRQQQELPALALVLLKVETLTLVLRGRVSPPRFDRVRPSLCLTSCRRATSESSSKKTIHLKWMHCFLRPQHLHRCGSRYTAESSSSAHDAPGWEPPGGTGQALRPREASKKCEVVLPL